MMFYSSLFQAAGGAPGGFPGASGDPSAATGRPAGGNKGPTIEEVD